MALDVLEEIDLEFRGCSVLVLLGVRRAEKAVILGLRFRKK